MFKSAGILLAAAVLVTGCSSDPVVEPSQQMTPATPVVVEPAAPAEPAAPTPPVEAMMPAPDQPPPVSKPVQLDGGKYRVSVASEPTPKEAQRRVQKLEAGGLRVQTEPTEVAGKAWQRVVVPGLRNGREARQMVVYLDQVLGIKGAWVIPKAAVAAAPPAPAAAPAPAPAPAAAPAAPAEHPQN